MRILQAAIITAMLGAAAAPLAPGDFAARVVATHNAERARVGTNPLAWSNTLATDAQKWADHLAKTNSFEHASQTGEGENLWSGTRDSYTFEEMVNAWVDEKFMYKAGRFPDVTTTKSWQDVGHYTQLIWGNTTHVGCGIARNAEEDYLVCRYGPPGNWEGQDPIRPINN
jgi:uncharacterized protein YkwD